MSASDDTVLVTGGTGYLGGWCIATLLDRGYTVRTTVRDVAREDAVRAALTGAVADPGDRLSVVAADLLSGDGWADAVAGCRYVLHVASPFPPAQPKDPDDLIVPARDGALRVLGAALDAGVERIVLTSSIAAVSGTPGEVLTEDDWNDGDDMSLTPYVRSKTIAEREAWRFVRERGAEDRLAVVNPGLIVGPVLSDDFSYSVQLIERLLGGKVPAAPKLGFTYVDVRDVADLHVRAMTHPDAGGKRFLATDRFLWTSETASILRERLGDEARKVPTRVAPNFAVRAMGMFDPAIRTITGDLGRKTEYSSDRARTLLGWSTRPVEDAVEDTARSLLARGVVTVG
ncbi:MAG: aldehyde reductase [Solirubrobacteraceae bacterium]|nr:aldehyde reductase [Solirubrobacteraceae bacterium]